MNKIFSKVISLLFVTAAVFLLAGPAVALSIVPVDESDDNGLLFGQNHFYTVIFRGNGEAITYAKLALTNPDEKPLTEFSFEISKVSPSEIVMYQMKLPQTCIRYGNNDSTRPCLESRDPDYAQKYYYYGYSNGQAEYQKIQYTKSGNLYRLTLPTPVEQNKSTAVIVAYAAKGYVKESAGLYKFNFETLKVPSRIEEIRVAVDVDSDLLLKGKRSSVNYNTGFEVNELANPQSVSSRDLDRVVGNIGSYGPLVKEAKSLAPNESFLVKGEYGRSWIRLYLSSLLWTVLIIATICAGAYFLTKLLKRRQNQIRPPKTEISQPTPTSPQALPGPVSIFDIKNILVGLFSAVLVIGLTCLLNFLANSDIDASIDVDPIFGVIALITIFLLYVLAIFGSAIVVGIKRGWKSLLAVLVAEFLWLVIFLILYLGFFQSGLTSGGQWNEPIYD